MFLKATFGGKVGVKSEKTNFNGSKQNKIIFWVTYTNVQFTEIERVGRGGES